MWQLNAAYPGGSWLLIGYFHSATDAGRKIIELEEYPVSGVFFRGLIETEVGTEEEAFAHLEHTGKRTGRFYAVKRVRH
jgi:hypothetical protein